MVCACICIMWLLALTDHASAKHTPSVQVYTVLYRSVQSYRPTAMSLSVQVYTSSVCTLCTLCVKVGDLLMCWYPGLRLSTGFQKTCIHLTLLVTGGFSV